MFDGLRVGFTARDFDRDEMEELARALGALGAEVALEFPSAKSARVTIACPHRLDAERMRTRNAGRKASRIPNDAVIKFRTVRAFLEWYDGGRSAEEGMAALGMSRSAFYRALRRMRGVVAEQDAANASRPEGCGVPRMADMPLSDFR